MGKILIDQYILCKSFLAAKEICVAFSDFHIQECYFGSTQTVKASRNIRKARNKTYSHYVLIRYTINFKGEFNSYGFIDEKSIKRYPELPSIIEACNKDDRWRIICDYEQKDDWLDICFYKDFEDFYKNKLVSLLNRIDMACKVSFSCKYHTDNFQIFYEECGQAYERGFIANVDVTHGLSLLGIADVAGAHFNPLPIQTVWDWSQKYYYDKKSDWYSETRAWTALSYVINRNSYESLLYSIMGLEAVYTKDNKRIKEQLRQSVPKVIDYISEDDINELYKLRSEFVHGDIAYPMYGENNHDYSKGKLITKAAAVLLETIRLLVQNKATKIRVENGNTIFICDRTLSGDMENK